MDFFNQFFKKSEKGGSTLFSNLLFILGIGVILLIFGNSLFENFAGTKKSPMTHIPSVESPKPMESYESLMEKRLEEILSRIEGVGKINVMVTLSYGKEIVIAEDLSSTQSLTKENDAQGGTREIDNKNSEEKTVMYTTQQGTTEPVILKEKQPIIEGIIIIAEGGNQPIIQNHLSRAAQTLLSIPAHKVQVFQMQNKK